ncbi:MAG TPA: hypothetical protein VIM69_03890 [Opitutaceae bacterium]
MPQCTCEYCGHTFSVLKSVVKGGGEFCNLGCAVRARVPVDGQGNFPVNQHLIATLLVGFLFLNQAMLAGLSAMLSQRGRVETSLKMAWASFVLGGLVWIGTLLVQRREKVGRGKDFVFAGSALGILLASIWKTEPRVGLALAAAAVLLVWNFRGLAFKQRFM